MYSDNITPAIDSGPSRRHILRFAGLGAVAVAAAPLLSACGSSSSSKGSSTAVSGTTSLSMQLPWVEDSEFSPLYLADSKGHLSDQKVSLKLIPGGSDIGAIEGIVAGGTADLGISTDITSVIAAIADGNPLVCIGALYQSNLNVLMSDPANPIKTVEQLVGKKIGGPQGVQVKFDAMFKLAGLKPDYTFVPTGYGPEPLIKGDVDALAGFITDEVLSYKDAEGKLPGILSFTDAGLPAYTLPIITTTDTVKNKAEALKGMLTALRKGFADDIADPTAGPKLAVTKYGKSAGLKLASEIEHNKAYVPLAASAQTKQHGLMWVDQAYVAGPIYRGMKASGLKTADVTKVVDMSLLQQIPMA